jgi:hypothetical protein
LPDGLLDLFLIRREFAGLAFGGGFVSHGRQISYHLRGVYESVSVRAVYIPTLLAILFKRRVVELKPPSTADGESPRKRGGSAALRFIIKR